MAGAGRLLAQDESDGSGVRYRLVYEKIDKCDVADARFLPWCACPLSPACRSLATTAKSGAAMVGGFSNKARSVHHDPAPHMGEVRRREAGKHQGMKGRAAAGGG